jgi:lysophospholipase L1-like esterase
MKLSRSHSSTAVLIALGLCCLRAIAADLNAPALTITSPQPNAIVSGAITVSAVATSSAGIAGVSFWVGFKPIANEDTTPPYSVPLSTTTLDDGPQTITALARDTANRISVAIVTFQVHNGASSLKRVMPLGDSLTFGFVGDGIHDNDGGYRAFLWNSLVQTGFTNVDFVGSFQNGPPTIDRDHEGHAGLTIAQLNDIVSGPLNTFNPKVILLLIGINNFDIDNTPGVVVRTLTEMGTLLDTIRRIAPDAQVLVSSLLPLRVVNQHPNITPQEIITFNIGLSVLVNFRTITSRKFFFVDMYTLAGLDTSAFSLDYGPDGLHLSPQGYNKIAGVWYRALTPLLLSRD